MKYLNTSPTSHTAVKTKLMGHLSSCVQKVNIAPSLPPQYHQATTASASFTPSVLHHHQQQHSLPSATPLCSLPGRAATPSESRLSSFTPVRKSPTLGIEAPCLDCSSIPSTSHLPSTSSLSPSGIELRMMNGFLPLASAPSGGPSASGHSGSSASHSAASPSRPSSEPAYLAALDIEEIRNKFGDVWRPW